VPKIKKIISQYSILYLAAFVYGAVIGSHKDTFSLSYSLTEYENRYSRSQYVLGPAYTHLMGDGDIYTYAGIRYIQGENPVAINFEHPPLIKYLFGLSYFLVGFPAGINMLFLLLAAFCFWQLSSSMFDRHKWRNASFLVFLFHPFIISYFTQTMLDFGTMALSLLVLAAYQKFFFSKSKYHLGLFILASGLFLSAKYPLPLNFTLIVSLLLWLFIKKKLSLINLVISASLIIGVYLTTYTVFLLKNPSIIDFLKFEWSRWLWYQGKISSSWGGIIEVILFGKRPVVWDMCPPYALIPGWHLGVPILFLCYAASFIYFGKILKHNLFPYFVYLMITLVFLYFGADSDRFLVPLVPGWVLFGCYFIKTFINGKKDRQSHS